MRISLRLLILLLVVAPLHAWSYLAYEQIAVAGTAIGFTAAKITPSTATGVQVTAASCITETAQIRYTIDGTTPTAAVGMPIEAGQSFTVTGHDALVNFRAIRTGSSATLDCTYSAP